MPKRAPTHRPHRPGVHAAPVLERKRLSAHKRGYGRKWEKLRDAYRNAHPLCEEHFRAGEVVEMDHVDHKVPRSKGGKDEWSNLQSLCHSCHSRKTATEDTNFAKRGPKP